MSKIQSSAEHLTLNADGSGNDIKFQSNGSEVASIDQAGLVTATSFAGAGSTPSIVDGGNATAITIASNETVTLNALGGNSYSDAASKVLKTAGTQHTILSVETSSTGGHNAALELESNGNPVVIGTSGNDKMFFQTNSATVMLIDNVGNTTCTNADSGKVISLQQKDTSNNFGTPTLMLGGHTGGDSYAANAVHSIGFNYATTIKPAVGIGYVPTTTAGNTYGDLRFATRNVHTDTAPTTRMVINHNGHVAIAGADGTYDHSGLFNTKMTSAGTQISMWNTHTNGNNLAFHNTAGGMVGRITNDGSSTSYHTSSDYRLKENVDYTWDATTRLKQLKPARFNFIADDTNTLVDGFIAHEVSSIVPEAISGEKDAVTAEVLYTSEDVETQNINYKEVDQEVIDGTKTTDDVKTVATKNVGDVKEASVPDMQGIDQSKLVPLLVKTIQELEARITALEA